MVAAKLGVSLPHTPPYTPRGRGKIERFFRSARDGFLTGRDRTTLDRLNADLTAWISQYHQKIHSSLGMSPLDRRLGDTGPQLRQIAPTQDIDDLFRMELVKRVGSDGCVRLFRKRFEIPGAVPGSAVTVYYLPWDEERVLVGPERLQALPVDTIKNARRFDKPRRGKPTASPEENDR
jgi:hypothetical protein